MGDELQVSPCGDGFLYAALALHGVSQSFRVPTVLKLLFACAAGERAKRAITKMPRSAPVKAHGPRPTAHGSQLIAHSFSANVAQRRRGQNSSISPRR